MPLPAYARADGQPAIFIEVTDRQDLGDTLHAPQADESGGGRYRLIEEAEPGDTVLHYHRPSGGITAISRVAGAAQDTPITWAAKGTSARSRHVDPYERPGWLVPLTGYTALDPPLPQSEIKQQRHAIFSLRDQLEAEHGSGLHFPYYRYGADDLRTVQAYMAVMPRQLLALFPALQQQIDRFEATPTPAGAPNPDPDDPDLYFANEDMEVGGTGQVFVDPEAMTRANQAHARLQNALRDHVLYAGGRLHPTPQTANVDLAWRDGQGRLTIAEVKSLTDQNEAHQLRYGIGQLLDYRDELADDDGHQPRCILAIPRAPHRVTWARKCQAAGIELAWPGHWPRLP